MRHPHLPTATRPALLDPTPLYEREGRAWLAARYVVALAITGVALLGTMALQRWLGTGVYVLFVAGVAAAARFAGTGPGVLASVASMLALDYYFLPPLHRLELGDPVKWAHLAVFLAVAAIVSTTVEALRRERALVVRRAVELRHANDALEEANTELEQQMEEIQSLADAREEVLATVAHDLRNPLNLVSTNASLLLDLDLPPERRAALLGVTHRAVEQMDRLITDLLDVTRIESGRLTLELASVPVDELVRDALELVRAAAAERGVRLEAAVEHGIPPLWADGGRALQMLGNLLSNAIKFTPRGGLVCLRARALDGGVLLEVADNGAGIPAEDRERLFERFWQAHGSDRRGVGLGLAIVKGIVDAHGGRITVESDVGVGTTFRVTLPGVPRRAASPPAAPTAPGASG